jgi:hypothetical protein
MKLSTITDSFSGDVEYLESFCNLIKDGKGKTVFSAFLPTKFSLESDIFFISKASPLHVKS